METMRTDMVVIGGGPGGYTAAFYAATLGKKVVLIYKNKTHTYINLPNSTTKKYQTMMSEYEEDPNIVAILSSNQSQDAYEVFLYPKAKDKSVDYVIKHYNTYFKPIIPGEKLRVPL